jgi:broad specificity phosphatase PhoE
MNGWKSPLLGITFQLTDKTLAVVRPDGKSFESYMDVTHRANAAEARAEAAQRQAKLLADKLRELGINPDAL